MPHIAGNSVAAELRRLSTSHGFSVVDHVVLTSGRVSAVIDHVVVDRYGVLIIDVELHPGATIAGSDTDGTWTATFPGGQVTELRNPLYLNAGNENLVKQTLTEGGIRLEPGEVRSVIAFARADVSHLSLVEVSAAKVKTADNLGEFFEARYSLPPNSGRLTGPDIDRVVAIVSAYSQLVPTEEEVPGSWFADPAVVAAAAVSMPAARPPSVEYTPLRMPAELAGHHTSETVGPSLRAALLTLATIVAIVLTLVAGVVFFPQLQEGSVLAWTAALVVLAVLAEIVAANIAAVPSNVGRARPGGALGWGARFAARLVFVFLFVALSWTLVAGGVAERIGASLAARFAPAAQQPAIPASPGVMVAKRRLKQKAPQVYTTTSNLNSPAILPKTEGRTSYTWTYTPKGSSVPTSFTLTIDIEGKVVSP